MNTYHDEEGRVIPRWRYVADEIFDAYETCIHINVPDEHERAEAHRYFMHKLVWVLTGENSVADKVDALVHGEDE